MAGIHSSHSHYHHLQNDKEYTHDKNDKNNIIYNINNQIVLIIPYSKKRSQGLQLQQPPDCWRFWALCRSTEPGGLVGPAATGVALGSFLAE